MSKNVVRALRHIETGEAITCFYPATEWEMAEPFECHCGAPNCLGTITGAKNLSLVAVTDSAPDKAHRE